jgi:hypothetical protein
VMISAPYTVKQAKALHALAESNPTPERYARERARILNSSLATANRHPVKWNDCLQRYVEVR